MRNMRILAVISFCIYHPIITLSQTLNWGALKKDQKNIINVNAGIDHGFIFGAAYGYQLKSRLPIILNAEYSFPSGKKLFDDFKTKMGGQVQFYQTGDFHFTGKFQAVFRRYWSDFVRLVNFGSDLSATAGFYKLKWFVAGEAGFDKAIITHFKHSEIYKEIYPLVKDGWYEPSAGGNFYYGLQTGYSFKRRDAYIKAGKVVNQDFQTQPVVPFFAQLGLNFKLR